eukprot:4159513-Pyramimonas_sp.AAC.2
MEEDDDEKEDEHMRRKMSGEVRRMMRREEERRGGKGMRWSLVSVRLAVRALSPMRLRARKRALYEYKVDMVHKRAYRLDVSKSNPAPEYAKSLNDNADASESDEVIAVFKDDSAHVIPGLTYKELRAWASLEKPGKGSTGNNIICEVACTTGNNKIRASKWSRHEKPEMGIWEVPPKGRPKMLLHLLIVDGMVGHEAMLAKQAKLLAAGECTKEDAEIAKRKFIADWKQERKEKEQGNTTGTKMKRPAAAKPKGRPKSKPKPKVDDDASDDEEDDHRDDEPGDGDHGDDAGADGDEHPE